MTAEELKNLIDKIKSERQGHLQTIRELRYGDIKEKVN